MHPTEDDHDAPTAYSHVSRVGPEKMRRIEIRGVRTRNHLRIVIFNLEDTIDELDALKRATQQALEMVRELYSEAGKVEDEFGPEWP